MDTRKERLTLTLPKTLITEIKMQALREDKKLYDLAEEIFELYLSIAAEDEDTDKKRESLSKSLRKKASS